MVSTRNLNKKHRIGQQTLELEWPMSGANAIRSHQLTQEFTPFLHQQLLPAMETLFDNLTADGQTIRCEKIELNLGEINVSSWQQNLCQRLLNALGERLREKASPINDLKTDNNDFSVIAIKQLFYFLRYGRLPRWNPNAEGDELRRLPSQFSQQEWREFSRLLKESDGALRRFVQFCTEKHWRLCLQNAFAMNDVDGMLAFFNRTNLNNAIDPLWQRVCWLMLLRIASHQQDLHRRRQLILEWFLLQETVTAFSARSTRSPANDPPISTTKTSPSSIEWLSIRGEIKLDTAAALKTVAKLSSPWREWLQQAIEQLSPQPCWLVREENSQQLLLRVIAGKAVGELIQRNNTSVTTASQSLEISTLPRSKIAGHKQAEKKSLSLVETSPAEEKLSANQTVAVAGAGAVIAHPFLAELFRELKLLENTGFRDTLSQYTAVRLVSYLTFGELPVEEYDLLLAKHLCAMPWHEVLPAAELSPAHKTAADQLLLAILKHWQALKSQSPEFLRQQFFWRQGKLKSVDDGWRLSIEKRAQDILLDKLPWGTGVIRTPWMKTSLHVEWNG